MPSLQVDVPVVLEPAVKREMARRLGVVYTEIMDTTPDIITVVVHDVGPGSVWRCTDGDPVEAALVMADIRGGRDRTTRGELARAVIGTCAELTHVDPSRWKVEFTQHTGDEMFHGHLGDFNTDWAPGESGRPT